LSTAPPPTRRNSSSSPGPPRSSAARLDVRVELTGEHAGHVVGRRAEVERARPRPTSGRAARRAPRSSRAAGARAVRRPRTTGRGPGSRSARRARRSPAPRPRTATKRRPDLISHDRADLARRAIVGRPSPSSAAATDTQAASNPASAGRVPSIGSTTSTSVAPVRGRRDRGPPNTGRLRRALGTNASRNASASASMANVTSPPAASESCRRPAWARAPAARARAARGRAPPRGRAGSRPFFQPDAEVAASPAGGPAT
jgi:hypothetical protein